MPAMSGTRPHLISMIDIRASGVRKRMSAPSASWKPPPKATPWIAAITGTGSCRQPHTACWGKLASPWVRAERSRFSPPAIPLPPVSFIAAKRPISRPAQNARPSPDNTTARTPFSWASRSVAATIASNIAASSAFILSARTSRTSAMPSEIEIETRCSMRILLHCYSLLPLYRTALSGFSQSTN